MVRNSSVLPAASVGAACTAVVSWQLAGQLNLTVVVKCSFALGAGGEARWASAEPLSFAERADPARPRSGLLAVRETVPQLRQAEVLLFGSAHAPPSGALARRSVRLAVGRGEQTLVDKSLLVVGERHGRAPPAPFRRMPLGWERAYGGIGSADNPLGVGGDSVEAQQPNVLVPGAERERPGGFGPIPAAFAVRKRLLGGADRHRIEGSVVEVPDGFDWAYFQAAPLDQRAASWHGDEWLLLEGLSPAAEVLRCTLPGGTAVARLYGARAAGVPQTVPLRGDLLLVEPDRDRCSLVFRGGFPVSDAAALDGVVVLGAVQPPGRPIAWPSEGEARALVGGLAVEPAAGGEAAGLDATRVMSDADPSREAFGDRTMAVDPAAVRSGARAPFALARPDGDRQPEAHAPIPGAPWAPSPARPLPAATGDLDATLLVDGPRARAAAAASLQGEASTLRLRKPAAQEPPPPSPELPSPSAELPPQQSPSAPAAESDDRASPDPVAPAYAEPLGALDIEPVAAEPSRPATKKAPRVPTAPQRGSPADKLYGSLSRAIKKPR